MARPKRLSLAEKIEQAKSEYVAAVLELPASTAEEVLEAWERGGDEFRERLKAHTDLVKTFREKLQALRLRKVDVTYHVRDARCQVIKLRQK